MSDFIISNPTLPLPLPLSPGLKGATLTPRVWPSGGLLRHVENQTRAGPELLGVTMVIHVHPGLRA